MTDAKEIETIRLVDLFAGTGAFSYAFHATGKVKTVFANDILPSSEDIFNLNNELSLTREDLIGIDIHTIPKFDILTAGFPCQPFSIAGLQKGFDDIRSNVFWKILEIIKHHMPNIVILENVKNLQTHDTGNTFNIITDNISKLGYTIKYNVLNTRTITSIPQNRERIYMVCFRCGSYHADMVEDIAKLALETIEPLHETIEPLHETAALSTPYSNILKNNNKLCDAFNLDFDDVQQHPISQFLETHIPDKYYYTAKSAIYVALASSVIKHISTNTIYQYRRYYVRENKNNVCPTLTANMGQGGHNVPIILDDHGIRKLTPRECFNLQGFPSDYKLPLLSDSKLYSLAGNAVSLPVVNLIVNRLVELL